MIYFIICRTIVITYKKIQMLFFLSNNGYYIAEGVTHLFRKSVQFQMIWKTYVIPLLLVPFLFLVAYWWTDRSGALLVREPWWIVPYFLYMLFLGGTVQEEYGWRGYLLDALQSRLPPLLASLSLGVLWSMWHTLLFVMVGLSHAYDV